MVWNKKISALLAVVALCGVATVGAADYTILEKAEKVETTVYGTTQTGALNTRIAALYIIHLFSNQHCPKRSQNR